jgi:NAD(P)-dependent dehydrogenase (short-subunit alcohol dehydrogenase family)
MTTFKQAIVVGASSGIGAALVRRLAEDGCDVVALARRAEALDELRAECEPLPGSVTVRTHDVRDVDAVPELFEELVRGLGGLDLLVFAAGIMPEIGAQEYDTQKDLDILAINTGGAIAWCNPTAELFQSQRSGTIIGISSIAGDRGRRGNPLYGTSKAALNHYLEALRNRLGVFGVHVCTIKPGYVDTAMTRGKGLKGAIPAEQAARLILRAARLRLNVWYVPFKWTLVGLVLRLIPSFVFRRLEI